MARVAGAVKAVRFPIFFIASRLDSRSSSTDVSLHSCESVFWDTLFCLFFIIVEYLKRQLMRVEIFVSFYSIHCSSQ
jgi:hypothetical protein